MEDEDPYARPREDFDWFTPWTWRRTAQVGMIIVLSCTAVAATWFYVMLYALTHHAMD
ncbi:MAG: hypothetical protein Q8K78_14485 [Planctomycetaceae bacterium]|nr:hypothetical protein [Planctomycetaceae bacterium]